MNKQELIKKYEEYENGLFDIGARAACQLFLKDLEQLDEPEKAKVPQFVADWIEEAKKSCETVVEFFGYKFSNIEMIKYLKNKERINLVARAWLDGYEVEEEERYRMKMSNANFDGNIQILSFKKNSFFWSSNWEGYKTHHTRKELEEAGFGWVFDCPGVEIEEVKE